uniref:Putative gastric mucin n=1 Tax=Ornithodoros turicata TaxID=34597 RepID=A0A2R5L6L3_9ACAR
MTFPENRHGMSTLESKIMELKKQIHHLTILANYKEKELGCIRNLRLAKEEALKQLECKYPSIFSPPRTCRGTASVASAFHTDVPDIVAKAAALSGLTASERNFRAAQHRAAFSDTYSSSQTASKDSAFQTFRKIAPKQPSCVSAEDRHPHIIPLAGPFWIPDLAAGANASPKSPKRHHQDSTASHPAYELPASFRWWSQRTSPDAAAGYGVPATQNDVHRGSSASISSPSGALLDCNTVQSHTAPSLSPLLHMKQSFTYTPRSVPSDSDECAPRTSDTHSRDVLVSARSSSDVYAVQTSVSPDNVREPEGVLQRRALHMYAQLLRGSTEKDPMDITATLLREKQVAAGHSSSQSRAFYNAMDTWMKTAQNIRENVAGSCTTRRENDTKAMPQATSIERQFSEQQADTGHHEARSAASRFRAAVCLNCGDPRVKYVCSCCRTQTFCSELCQMELWSHRNGAGKEA